MDGEIFYHGAGSLDELMAGDTLPEQPVVMVLAGDRESVYYGAFDEAATAAAKSIGIPKKFERAVAETGERLRITRRPITE